MNTGNSTMRATAATIAALVFFLLLAQAVSVAGPRIGVESVAARHALLKLLMIAITLAGWALSGRTWRELGFCRGRRAPGTARWVWLACGCMILASTGMILADARHPMLKEMTFGQIVLTVWVLSSVAEELYVRGLVQSWLQPPGVDDAASTSAGRTAIVLSALLFAAMHVPLIWKGAGPLGGGIVVAATLGVGYACAVLRARTGSLLLPIIVHAAANVAAPIGGVIGVVIYRVVHGHLPELAG